MEVIERQECPVCRKKAMQLIQEEKEVPHFGKCYLMSMNCTECLYHSSDIEVEKKDNPKKYEFTITKKEDLNVRVIKSGTATVKIPQLRISVTPGVSSIGYISNIEGVLRRFKKIVEDQRDTAEDLDIKKTAKNLLKKFWKVECGELPLKIIIEDPSGNSAIVSNKSVISKK
ncbi:ZPR1 zinc finger domain-containing protein [Candidatus Woesearchaeota archaeon]|nr:ZPR1 zinc finger domain-containing protein [Candidatus Woesearchaeota archaeon]